MLSSANVLPYNSKYAKRNYVKDNTLFIQMRFQTADIYGFRNSILKITAITSPISVNEVLVSSLLLLA